MQTSFMAMLGLQLQNLTEKSCGGGGGGGRGEYERKRKTAQELFGAQNPLQSDVVNYFNEYYLITKKECVL